VRRAQEFAVLVLFPLNKIWMVQMPIMIKLGKRGVLIGTA